MTEIWKRIPDFSTYEVSNLGKARSLRTTVNGKPRVMKTKLDKGGYVKGSSTYGVNALDKKFNVTPRTIMLVVRNETWNKRREVRNESQRHGSD